MSSIISLLKKLPIDIGQANNKHTTAGKRIAFKRIRKVKSGQPTALDIGCRDGFWSEKLKDKGYTVTSLDIEPLYSNAITHNIEEGLPFKNSSFDVIWCTEVIEHIQNVDLLISETERVLRPGGVAVFTTPNSRWWLYWIIGLWGWTPKKVQNPDHKQFFGITDIQKVAPGYKVLGYFPYSIVFLPITYCIGFLSPTFIFFRTKEGNR